MTVGEYEITSPATAECEFCGQEVAGRVMVQLYGGSLWVCQACYELIQQNRSRPYSRVMDDYSVRACGYLINRKMARMGR
jgi:ribosome-binding protein aMBF1 (putative translation factor)